MTKSKIAITADYGFGIVTITKNESSLSFNMGDTWIIQRALSDIARQLEDLSEQRRADWVRKGDPKFEIKGDNDD